ncbi:GH116 family glycosyl-hydrolase [Streptomyces sp. NPDC051322]|uniref:GH116 family glycosyl-hydrolase n=1 Tax=Streptomyces sp. NPDC051322 TaxID=3154645 RepID=UPI00344BBB4B
MTTDRFPHWPVLGRYDQDHLRRVAMPLGGIGTGTVSLGGRGDLRDWEIVNRPAKGFTPERAFFALRAQRGDEAPVTLALEGAIDTADYEGAYGSPVPNHTLPRFRKAGFEVAYPLAQVVLEDDAMPLGVRLQAYNPMVPGDEEFSGLPVAVLRYVLTNPGSEPVRASICGSLPNFIGTDGSSGTCSKGRNAVRTAPGLHSVVCSSQGVPEDDECWGTTALSVLTLPDDEVTHRTAWAEAQWGNSLLDFWDDFSSDGRLEEREAGGSDSPTASLAVNRTVPAGGEVAVTFLLTWRFPNRLAWDVDEDNEPSHMGTAYVGNHYATLWPDAWHVAEDIKDRLPGLERTTVAFVREVCASDLPQVVREAALNNLSTLRTQTCFRTEDGRFYGWEGCGDRVGSCLGSCTHVWNYESASAHLYGSLARSMREIEFAHATDERGLMSFRVMLPLADRAQDWHLAAADGQMGCLVKLYREWCLSGDDAMLRSLWPAARRAMEFCWTPGGWDADQDGVMEGCQHNTMDVEYYGPNPQMAGWYLAALRACEEMARHLGEVDFAQHCRDLFERGSAWVDANLFNGSWYEHTIAPVGADAIADGLRHHFMGARDTTRPDMQLGAGCLTDQLVGQSAAKLYGLGTVLDPENVGATLDGIVRHNRIEGAHHHFNHKRSYVLGDESGLLMCTYPDGRREERPFPYANEVMTGCEYTAAIGLVQEGRREEAVQVVRDIRDRFDGWRRNPFDEAECGHHYVRAMASWGVLLAWTGFGYQAGTSTLRLRGEDGARWFWSTGDAWGTSRQRLDAASGSWEVDVEVHGGRLSLGTVELEGAARCTLLGGPRVLTAGGTATVHGTVPGGER